MKFIEDLAMTIGFLGFVQLHNDFTFSRYLARKNVRPEPIGPQIGIIQSNYRADEAVREIRRITI
jgi:hypothetical protein